MDNLKMTIFVGSPRKKGTSFTFARTLSHLSQEMGKPAEILFIMDYFEGKKELAELKEILKESDTIGLVMPMYVDTLPSPVIWFFEKLTADFKADLRGKSLWSLSQCGFPDVALLQPSIESCRFFALANGMVWRGGLGYGGGGMIDGAFLETLGKKGESITAAFKIALEDILAGRMIRPEVQQSLIIKIPKVAYRPMATLLNYRCRKIARKYGVKGLKAKALLKE